MLVELNGKAGNICSQAKEGKIRCPLIVRSTSEDVVTGHIVESLKLIDTRHWLSDLLNIALNTRRFPRQVYRNFQIRPWQGKPPFPRNLLKWDEGSTEVDVQLTWENPATTIFIEAKYGSKLSSGTSNNNGEHGFPGDQLIRNIRVGLLDCGYYQESKLFHSQPRDFAVIVLSPERGQPLVQTYRDEARIRAAIPHSELLGQLPKGPFVGELSYADIVQVLTDRRRFLSRTEQRVIDGLEDYLRFKFDQRPRANLNTTAISPKE
ncbi:hypothetical protein BH11PLA2_BH11PLA2_38370 [soil metagenome]